MRKLSAVIAIGALVFSGVPDARAQSSGTTPVVFVHGMGSSAEEIGTTQFVPLIKALPDVHVFHYVEDKAETDGGPNDSQSAVGENAAKLAGEIDELSQGGRVNLIGYSMGGAIIRTYLARHRKDAERQVRAVILLDAVASGSWGYAFATEFPRRFDGSLGERLKEVMRSAAASSAAVDFTRPATRDLSPRSDHFRTIAPMKLPRNINYYTFWGDIRVVIERGLLHYDLPDFELPSLGDLGLLPGDPDPTNLPELGGQRFSPPVDDEHVAMDVPHEARIALDGAVIRDLISACGHKPTRGGPDCAKLAGKHFTIPNTHTAMPAAMDKIQVELDGGEMSLLEAVLRAIEDNT